MNPYYRAKSWAKLTRWQARRLLAALRWGSRALNKTPCVLGNAMPKSGSHLISQVVQGLTRLGPFVNPGFPPVTRAEDNRKLEDAEILANLLRMRPGDVAYGYVNAREPFVTALRQPGRAMAFVYRDPRDTIISHVFYAAEMHTGHSLHRYYTQSLKSMEERINAAIQGVEEPGSELSSIREKYNNYLGWFRVPEVLCLRFEDLILDRQATLGRFLDYLAQRGFHLTMERSRGIAILEQAIAPQKSGTFRKGKPGNWQDYFTPANKSLFKEVAGDLLIELGYESNNDW
jgi:hypothetical protein